MDSKAAYLAYIEHFTPYNLQILSTLVHYFMKMSGNEMHLKSLDDNTYPLRLFLGGKTFRFASSFT